MCSRICPISSALKIILFIVYFPCSHPEHNLHESRDLSISFTAVFPASRMEHVLTCGKKREKFWGKKKNPTRPRRNLNFRIVIRKRLFCRHMMLSLLSARGVRTTHKDQSRDKCVTVCSAGTANTEVCQCPGRTGVLQAACRASTAVGDMPLAQKGVGRTLTSQDRASRPESPVADTKHAVPKRQPDRSVQWKEWREPEESIYFRD